MHRPRRLRTLPRLLISSLLGSASFVASFSGTTTAPAPVREVALAPVPSVAALRENPVIRVGLTTDRVRVTVACASGLRVTDGATGRAVWKDSYRQSVTFGLRGPKPTEGRAYRVQVGSFANREGAEALASKLRGEITDPVSVTWLSDRASWRVRAGAADDRQGLASLVARLHGLGYREIWIADEPVPQAAPATLVLVDEDYNTMPTDVKVLAVEPAAFDALLAVDGAVYRGTLEVRLDLSGGIRVVDVVPLESYLRGVVPAELGPAQYPEIEALKAQAIAARTYVYRNLGQFSDEGFDLCDTPRCQVYGGVKAEHPLTDRAVAETLGEIAVYDGRPIDALYTSTCGGHTEDAAAIFPERLEPYLVGVPCAPEQTSRKSRRILLDGARALLEASAENARSAALLAVHGLIPRAIVATADLAAPVPDDEAGAWIDALSAACGVEERTGGSKARKSRSEKPRDRRRGSTRGAAGTSRDRRWSDGRGAAGADHEGSPPDRATTGRKDGRAHLQVMPASHTGASAAGRSAATLGATLAALAKRLVDRIGWGPRIDLLVGREEARGWLLDDTQKLDDDEAGAVAYFIRQKGWPEGRGGAIDPARRATRGDLCRLLRFVAEDCDLFDAGEGLVRGGSAGGLKVSGKTASGSHALAPEAFLFADVGAGPIPVSRLGLVEGDKVRLHVGGDGKIDFLLLLPGRQGVSDDRFSGLSSWQVAYSVKDLGKKLDDYLGSGDLVDLVPVRRGVSGRVTQLDVVGSLGERTISGFDIRTALGLRENLFVIDRQRDPKGALRRIVFTGRGWGHGVGMCQVGAYGMALRGASYREILTHYYRGIKLEKLP